MNAPLFSGDRSRPFWNWINKQPEWSKYHLYGAGVKLQNAEDKVRKFIRKFET